MRKTILAALTLGALCSLPAFALPRPATASFARGAQFEVAGYDSSKPALSGFPVLVRLEDDSPSGFHYSQFLSSSDGADLCFIDMEGNGLPFEIDTWNPNGTSLVWVTLPTMEHGTQFVMCWGGETSGKTVCGTNPFAGYKGVWHMDSVKPSDSSPNNFDGTNRTDNLTVVAGPIGDAVNVPRTNTSDGITCGNVIANSELTDGFTIEGWCRPTQYGGMGDGAAMFGKEGLVSLRINSATKIILTTPYKKNHDINLGSGVLPAVNIWWHFAATFKMNTSSGLKFYLNGQLVKTLDAGDIDKKTEITEMFLGNNQWNQAFKGDLDELRFSAGLRSADWIAASYATQSDPEFLTPGAAQSYEATAAPDVGLSAPSAAIAYTNATLTAIIGSLGKNELMTADASWVDPLLVVSENADLSAPLFSIPLSRVSSVPESIPISIVPLATNTTYYAQLQVTNSFNVAGESSIVSFTTHTPGASVGAAVLADRGFSTMAASVTVSDFGIGAESATMRLEASSDGFATVVAGSEVAAVIDSAISLSVSGLTPDTEYALRIRIRNDWGIDTTVALPASYTRAEPFATTGLVWTFSQDGSTIDISFGVTGIYDGATGTATLTYNGVGQGTEVVTMAETLSWPGIAAANGAATASVLVTVTLEGQTYTKTYTVVIAPGSNGFVVTDVSAHMSAATAIRINAGDVVSLPELVRNERYIVGNKLFGALDGNVLTALRPGILGVHCVGNDYATNTLAVIILPDRIGDCGIYIYDETAVSGNGLWNSPAQWEKVGSDTRDSYPNGTNDIAMIPYYSSENRSINLSGDITVGAIFFGGIRDVKTSASLGTNNSGYKRKITLARTDGKPILLQCCSSGSVKDRNTTLTINGFMLVDYTGDAVISGGWDGRDAYATQGRITFGGASTIPEGATVTFVEFDSAGTSNSQTLNSGQLSGAGIFWNRSAANIKISGIDALADFTGLLRDSSCGNLDPGRSGPIFVRTPSATNALYELVGFVARTSAGRAEISTASVGRFYTGWEPGYGSTYYAETNWFPGRGLVMHGGSHYSRATENSSWGVGKRERKVGERLAVANGFNYLYESSRTQKDGHPINWLEYNALGHENKATLLVWDPTRYSAPDTEYTNVVTVFHGWRDYAIGPAGDCTETALHPVVPWIAGPKDSQSGGWNNWAFGSFDGIDRLVRPTILLPANLNADGVEGANVELSERDLGISSDVTVNSIVLSNQKTKSKLLGEGRTLTVSSGGLILHSAGTSIGEAGNAASGSLVLGDATHPAYVWAKGEDASKPNEIWANVTAPGGFVSAYTGNLVLGGDQRGIGDELVVNAGTLQLGTATAGCVLARKLPVRVFANATLSCPSADSLYGTVLKFDGSAGWFGKVDLASNQSCSRLYVRDYPETPEWQNLVRGTYGSSESGAEFVRDDLFTGTGTLTVTSDDIIKPTMLIMR